MSLIGNSIANAAFAAIFLHNATTPMIVRGNTTFNSHIGLLIDRDNTAAHTTGMTVKGNIFVGNNTGSMNTLPDQISLWFKTAWTTTGDIAGFGSVDSNYLARPIDDNNTIMGTVYGVADTYYTLSSWRTYSGFDTHSNKSAKTTTSPDSLVFKYNYSASPSTISLPYKYEQVDGTINDGSITLAPYSSAVLIQNGSATGTATPPPFHGPYGLNCKCNFKDAKKN
jgi:hypothetical protein